MRRVYLDHAATTPVRPEVIVEGSTLAAMLPYFSDTMGNASSLHMFGQSAKRALEEARQTVAAAFGADSVEGSTLADTVVIGESWSHMNGVNRDRYAAVYCTAYRSCSNLSALKGRRGFPAA